MASNKFEKGSLWRKWDLHVHTPKSIIQNYGGDTPEAWEKFIKDLENLPSEYKALGINDYIFIKGYKKVLDYKNSGRLANIDLILPVVELRIDKFASIGDELWRKVNFHIIFSNQVTPDEIEAQFLAAIQHSISISPDIEGVDFKGVATPQALESIGKKIKETTDKTITGSDLKVGFWNIFFEYKTVKDICNGYFKGKCLTAVGKTEWDTMRWEGSAALKKDIINTANFSLTSLESPSDHEKHIKALTNQNVRNFLIDCSDAHQLSNSIEKDRIGNSFTWLKADTTFEGLKQVSNDRSRIFIGDRPYSLVRLDANRSKFIKQLAINKTSSSSLSEKWFENFDVPLNHSLVAIIGNKGNGKSALADTIGLIGNTPNYEFFSFLNSSKFRRKKPTNKSENFEGKLLWEDGSIDQKLLSENPQEFDTKKVKYIPQGYLEKLCNDDIEAFEEELREVIYSHLSDSDKLGKDNLDELIEYKTKFLLNEIENIKYEIVKINKDIIDLEDKETETFKKTLEEKLKEKTNEKNNHLKLKPKEVKPPTDQNEIDGNKLISEQLTKKRQEFIDLTKLKTEKETELAKRKISRERVSRVIQGLVNFQTQFEGLKQEVAEDIKELGISFNDLIKLQVDQEKLVTLLESDAKIIKTLEDHLNNEETGITKKISEVTKEGTALKEKLGEPSKNYEKYIDVLNKWKAKLSNIEGTPESLKSIKYYKSQLEYLKTDLKDDTEEKYKKRIELVSKLFKKKKEIINLYKSLFQPVSDFILWYKDWLDDYNIDLDVDFKVKGFLEKFFDHISLGSKGSFIGNPQGVERLKQILLSHDLSDENGVIDFLNEIIDHLKFDQRNDFLGAKRDINEQLKSGYNKSDLYSFLFDLDFLEPEYKLKLGEKNLSELSPGERGALLLIFYLTIDQNEIPLIIDQPEENLDNQSVFKILVKFIIKAKEKRQIIIVTHNPNLAVACNAEQIIHVKIDKKNGNMVSRVSGSLESKAINDAVIDVLEGTFPALKTRTQTYKIIER